MDRAFRILTIYNRLLQNKAVNKKTLTTELNSSPRTIQRDIDDIRNFLYEANDWTSVDSEIKYDYKSESYTLKTPKHDSMYYMYDILTSLNTTMPVISPYFYQYLKSIIINNHPNNQSVLLKYLDRFSIDENKAKITSTSIASQAINENRYLRLNNQLLIPISLYYQSFTFHLIYQLNNELFSANTNKINFTLSNKTFDPQQRIDNDCFVTLEISKEAWSDIHYYYHTHVIEKYEEDYLIVTFKMSRQSAIELCFLYRSNIRIISPPEIKEAVLDELLLLQSTYLKQHIQN